MNTVEEIQTALGELIAAMAEKAVRRPRAELTIRAHEKMYVYLNSEFQSKSLDGKDSAFFHGETALECFDAARAYIAALPSPEEAVNREYLTRVASAIDYATEHSLPDEYVAPLRGVSTAMTSNLLSKEAAE